MPEPLAQRIAETIPPGIPLGMDLLDTPLLNKGTAFTDEERTRFGLHGLLPPHIEDLEEQVVRAYEAYQQEDNELERHIYLRALQDTNEVLFYRLLLDHIEEMTPIVYTPMVGQACQQFSHIYRRPRGTLYFLSAARLDPSALAESSKSTRRCHCRYRWRTDSRSR